MRPARSNLVTEPAGARLAMLLQGPQRHESNEVSLQILGADPAGAGVAAAELSRLTRERNVFRGHLLTFGGDF